MSDHVTLAFPALSGAPGRTCYGTIGGCTSLDSFWFLLLPRGFATVPLWGLRRCHSGPQKQCTSEPQKQCPSGAPTTVLFCGAKIGTPPVLHLNGFIVVPRES